MRPIVYRTENKLNGDFYYGVHNGAKEGYLGSGKRLRSTVKKYGRDNFVRRTIMEFDTLEEAYAFEKLMVDDLLINQEKCLNLAYGGDGGKIATKEMRLMMSKQRKGVKQSEETKRKRVLSNPTRREVVCIETGVEYASVGEAAKSTSIPTRTLRRWLDGLNPNKSTLRLKTEVTITNETNR